MKKLFFSLSLLATMLTSCSDGDGRDTVEVPAHSNTKTTMGSYLDYLTTHPELAKTSALNLGAVSYSLQYVRDSKDYELNDFCYGHLATNSNNFHEILSSFTTSYTPEDVWQIQLISQGISMCDEIDLPKANVKYLLVFYKDANEKAQLDYINLTTNEVETYELGEVRASISIYLLKKSGITSSPGITTIKDDDFDYDSVVFSNENYYVGMLGGPTYRVPLHLSDPSRSTCPLDCPPGDLDDCANFFDKSCNYTFDGPDEPDPEDSPIGDFIPGICKLRQIAKTLYNNPSYTQLSVNLGSKTETIYKFRDEFLQNSTLGKRYIINYYKIGKIINENHISLSLTAMVNLASIMVSDSDKLLTLVNYRNSQNTVLYNQSDANRYRAVLLTWKGQSTNAEWNSIFDGVITDLNANTGKNVSEIVNYMN